MEWVKTDATAVWVVDRRGEHVIDIHQNCCSHHQKTDAPIGSKQRQGHNQGNKEME